METASDYYSQPGYRGNLTTSQNLALFKLWRRFLRLCETPSSTASGGHSDHSRRGASSQEPYSTSSSASASGDRLQSSAAEDYQEGKDGLSPQDDKLKDHLRSLEESKDLNNFVRTHGGAALRREFWAIVKGEHADAVMLRFLRARKWDVDRALSVIGSTCAFRVQNNVSKLLKEGELGLTKTVGGINIFRNGINYIRGATATGEPVYFIEVGSHYSSNQTAEELKKGVIYFQECLGMMMPPPVERKVVIFNLNNFGLRNMDWGIVLFMAKTMENFYPETLSRVYVHGAPWIFKPIWTILRPLLDPVVRDKIRLTWKVDELAEHIPANHLPKGTMHGNLNWEFEYPLPQPGENDIQLDTEKHDELRLAYLNVVNQFETATRALARSYSSIPEAHNRSVSSRITSKLGKHRSSMDSVDDMEPEGSAALKANRDVLATKLRVAWLRLKPYVIGKTEYDRWGAARDDGTIKWVYETVGGRREEQVLGEGTSLPALERNLAEIEEALYPSASTEANGHSNGSVRDRLAAPHAKSNLGTAPVLTQTDVARSEGSKHAVTESASEARPANGTASERGQEPATAQTTLATKGIPSVTSNEARPSYETSNNFEKALPVHPSDPSFDKARNGDTEVKPDQQRH